MILAILKKHKTHQRILAADVQELKSRQAEILKAITEMQAWMDAMTMGMDEAGEGISDIKDKKYGK